MAEKIDDRTRITRASEIVPYTRAEGDADEPLREIEIIVATDAPVRVWGVDEILPMHNKACDLARFRGGKAPFLADHRNSIESILGRITKPRFSEGKLLATVELADTDSAKRFGELVKQGMANNISVGYDVEKWSRKEADDENGVPTYTAKRWQPVEASAVAVPVSYTHLTLPTIYSV